MPILSEIFFTESARRKHNDLEYRAFALAHVRMDEVGEASGAAGGARNVVGVEMDEAQEESPPKRACTSTVMLEIAVMGTERVGCASPTPTIRQTPAPSAGTEPHRTVIPTRTAPCSLNSASVAAAIIRHEPEPSARIAPHRVPATTVDTPSSGRF